MASQPGKWEMRSWVQSLVPPPWVQTLAFPAHETGDEELRKRKYLKKEKRKKKKKAFKQSDLGTMAGNPRQPDPHRTLPPKNAKLEMDMHAPLIKKVYIQYTLNKDTETSNNYHGTDVHDGLSFPESFYLLLPDYATMPI